MDATSDVGSPGPVPPTPPPPPPVSGPRRLRRRPDDGHIAGVCAGVAEYFSIDPILVRIAAVVLLVSGPGLIAYVLAWIFVPAEPGQAEHGQALRHIDRKDRATQIFGIVLLGLGVSVIWGDWWSPARGWLFPLALMAAGAWLLLRPDDDGGGQPDGAVPPVPPAPPVPPVPGSDAWGYAAPITEPAPPTDAEPEPTVETATPGVDGSPDHTAELPLGDSVSGDTALSDAGDSGGGRGDPPTAPWDVPPAPGPGPIGFPARMRDGDHHGHHRGHRRRRIIGPTVFGVLLVWTGIAWLAGVGLTTGLAVGLMIVGLGFVFGSFFGGSRALIVPALVIAAALAVTATIDIPLSGPVGQQQWSPDTVAELEDVYEVSMGEGILDLTDVPLAPGDRLEVRGTVGLGHLVVLVAQDQDVYLHAEVGAGEILAFGEQRGGVGIDLHEGFGTDLDGASLILDLEAGMGQIEVRRGEDRVTADGAGPELR